MTGLSNLQVELRKLTTIEKKKLIKERQEFWLQESIPGICRRLWKILQKFLIVFPSLYLDESGFREKALSKEGNYMSRVGNMTMWASLNLN